MKTLEQLNSEAYDALVQIEQWQKKLQTLNQEIANFVIPKDSDSPAGK